MTKILAVWAFSVLATFLLAEPVLLDRLDEVFSNDEADWM